MLQATKTMERVGLLKTKAKDLRLRRQIVELTKERMSTPMDNPLLEVEWQVQIFLSEILQQSTMKDKVAP